MNYEICKLFFSLNGIIIKKEVEDVLRKIIKPNSLTVQETILSIFIEIFFFPEMVLTFLEIFLLIFLESMLIIFNILSVATWNDETA